MRSLTTRPREIILKTPQLSFDYDHFNCLTSIKVINTISRAFQSPETLGHRWWRDRLTILATSKQTCNILAWRRKHAESRQWYACNSAMVATTYMWYITSHKLSRAPNLHLKSILFQSCRCSRTLTHCMQRRPSSTVTFFSIRTDLPVLESLLF